MLLCYPCFSCCLDGHIVAVVQWSVLLLLLSALLAPFLADFVGQGVSLPANYPLPPPPSSCFCPKIAFRVQLVPVPALATV